MAHSTSPLPLIGSRADQLEAYRTLNEPSVPELVLVQVLIGNIVFRNLMGVYFPRILIVGFLHAGHRARLKNVSFFNQLIDAFRIRLLDAGQTF